MNILIFSYAFYPYNLVGAKRMTALASYLLNAGHKVRTIKAADFYYGENIIHENIKFDSIDVRGANWIEWVYNFRKSGIHECNLFHPDCCIISGGPFNYFFNIPYLTKKFKIPFIVDFRDIAAHKTILPKSELRQGFVRKKLGYIKNYFLEWVAIKSSAEIVLTTEYMHDYYKNRFPKYAAKMHTIYNGYDDKKLQDFNKHPLPTDSLSIAIFGKFSSYKPECAIMLRNACEILRKNKIPVSVFHVGEREEETEQAFASTDYYNNIPTMEYRSGMEFLSTKWVMVVSNYLKEAISTKVFDYIYLDHPILAFVPRESACEKIMKKFENCFFAYQTEDVVDALTIIWNQKISTLSKKVLEISKYSRTSQNKEYLELIEMTVNSNR